MKYKIYDNIEIEIDEQDIAKIESGLKPGCSWYFNKKNRQVKGWCLYNNECVKLLLNRFILDAIEFNGDVDHRDRNPLNFKRDNLRKCSHQENCFNTCAYMPDKGVRFRASRGKWQARIRTKEGRITLGSFALKEDALNAYKEAALKYHGEFTTLQP